MLPINHLNRLAKSGCDRNFQVMRRAQRNQERAMELNFSTVEDFVRRCGDQLSLVQDELNRLDPLTGWPFMMACQVRCGMALGQQLLRSARVIRRDLQVAIDDTWQSLNSELVDCVGDCASTVTDVAVGEAKPA